jgi:hypothetical protein
VTYIILLVLLTLAYGPLKPYRSESARLPLLYWGAAFAITGSIWRVFGYPGWGSYFLILSTASFLLILLYHTVDITLPLLVAWLAELTLMAIYLGCALQTQWALENWRELVPVLNNVGLLAVIWGYADGSGGYANRVLYPRLFDSPSMRHSVSMRNVSTNRQMGEEIR